ncbi:transcription initiation factor TFIID subunit 5-like isoform X3 [Varroa destructor]|uniref:Transcription initiation factor TFIID subunit 5 n=1 Tax=Varroa destructor TaxID=109461 RepID=A0A7M7K1S4_VARDE|nr:transcription initiation factor TFIID subunit 5-like isoform X3 [Varroa destructor]
MSTEGAPVADDAVSTSPACGEGTARDGYHTGNISRAVSNNSYTTNAQQQQPTTTATAATTLATANVSSTGGGLSNGHSSGGSPHDSVSEGSPESSGSQALQSSDPSLPNGEAKSGQSTVAGNGGAGSEGRPTGSIAAETHVKTESPDTLASSEAMHSLVDTVIKQECLRRLSGDNNGGASLVSAVVENGTTLSNINGPCTVRPKLEENQKEIQLTESTASSQTPTNGDVPELSGQKIKTSGTSSIAATTIVSASTTVPTPTTSIAIISSSAETEKAKTTTNAGTPTKSSNEAVVVNGEKQPLHGKQIGKEASDQLSLQAVLEYLRKHNLQETEKILKRESKVSGGVAESERDEGTAGGLSGRAGAEGDPDAVEGSYAALRSFVETSLDSYRHELAAILYPCFVHMYLELVHNGHRKQADAFIERFGPLQEEYFQEDIRQLMFVHRKDQMAESQLMQNFRSGQYTVRMYRDTYNALKRFLQDKKNAAIQNIVQENIYVDVYEGIARSRQQVDAVSGSTMGEASKQLNKAKVYYGLPKEPTIIVEEEDDAGGEDGDGKPKKKKAKKDSGLSKKTRADPNAPPSNRIPLPELRDADKLDRLNALKEAAKRIRLGAGNLPSICFYTLINSHLQATAVEINDEATMMGIGLQDSRIKVFSVTPVKLKAMKSAGELETIDREADDVLYRMMDERSSADSKVLVGHQGPVTSLSFSPDKQFLLSGSEDGTIRLWSLLTWSNVVSYKGHVFPVWAVQFAPVGYYFVSCGHDRTARLWATDSYQPLRVFAGHYADVDCVQFHPNSNYVATGSTDRSVRLWDVLSGACVRHMTGHKSTIYALAFSSCGRFLCSAGGGGRILVWDVATAHLLADLWSHTDTIHRLTFSREGTILTSGGMDCAVKLWDFTKLMSEFDLDEVASNSPNVRVATDGAHDGLLLSTYPTKSTSVLALHFTRRNVLMAAGSPV